jgi:hypothetical protein
MDGVAASSPLLVPAASGAPRDPLLEIPFSSFRATPLRFPVKFLRGKIKGISISNLFPLIYQCSQF